MHDHRTTLDGEADALRRELRRAIGPAYHLGRELPSGGACRLFLAVCAATGRTVVAKVLPPGADLAACARFRREVAVTALLRHPHVLPLLAAGATERLRWFLAPCADGGTLRERLRRGPLPVAEALRLLGQLADALVHAHAHGVLHGDVKPENVLLAGGRAVLADFGAARPRRPGRAAAALPLVGTPLYMAPELAGGDAGTDARADLYSLAVVGYELLAGRPPFTGPTPSAVLRAHAQEPVPPLRALRPEVPSAIATLLETTLAKAPAARVATAAAFRAALLAATAPARPRPPAPVVRARLPVVERPWRRRAGAALLAPVAAALLATAVSAAGVLGGLGGPGGPVARAAAPPVRALAADAAPTAVPRVAIAPSAHAAHGRECPEAQARARAQALAPVVVVGRREAV